MVDGLEDDGVCAAQLTRADTSGCADERAGRANCLESEGQQSWCSDEGKEKWKVDAIDVRRAPDEGAGQVAD